MKFSTAAVALFVSLATLASPSALAAEPSQLIRAESQFLDQCSGVELPYQFETVNHNAAILSCMLDHVVDTPALAFGFDEEPAVACWPPSHDNIQAICHDMLAKPAYSHCTSGNFLFDEMLKDDVLYEMSMSMSMSMSMNYDNDDSDDSETMIQERFCSILQGFSTDAGLECLEMVCDTSSSMPSDAPSSMPSLRPSAAPSASPSAMPSESPSASPTFIVSNSEVVQSSATAVSVVASLAVVAVSFFAFY